MTARVELSGISKRFGATAALTNVSPELLSGEIHGLVGENGAGKSTLVKILAGVHQPDDGTIMLDGVPTQIPGPAQSRALGIAVVHQEPRLFPDLTIAENVFIGRAPSGRLGSIDWRAMRRAAQALFADLDVQLDVGAPVRDLPMADQQLIEIAKALSMDAGVLILDEPTASLSAHEVERLFTIVRRLRDRGVAILFVSHRRDEVFALCDRATVFRDGRHAVTANTRHAHVWPEMLDALRAAGCSNYPIYLLDQQLSGVFDVEDFERSRAQMAAQPVNDRWQAEMAKLIDPCTDPATGFHRRLEEVFRLD